MPVCKQWTNVYKLILLRYPVYRQNQRKKPQGSGNYHTNILEPRKTLFVLVILTLVLNSFSRTFFTSIRQFHKQFNADVNKECFQR